MVTAGTRPTIEERWTKCPDCGTLIYSRRLARDLMVCWDCGHHFRLTAGERIDTLLDPGSVQPLPFEAKIFDPLGFVDAVPYGVRVAEARELKIGRAHV